MFIFNFHQCTVPDLLPQKMVGMIQSQDINSTNFQVEMSHLYVQVDTDSLDQEELFAKMMEHRMQVLLFVSQLQVIIIIIMIFIDNKLPSQKTQMSEIYLLWFQQSQLISNRVLVQAEKGKHVPYYLLF